jgi:hypothetical protein
LIVRRSDDTEVDWAEVASVDPTEARNAAARMVDEPGRALPQ